MDAMDANQTHSFAPADIPTRDLGPKLLDLFSALSVPREFVLERTQSVSHSFGTRTDGAGSSSAWFHFLCKNIQLRWSPAPGRGDSGGPQVVIHDSTRSGHLVRRLPHASNTWHRSGFFLRTDTDGGATTLVCFGATARVRRRLDQFFQAKAWEDVKFEPWVLFDLVVEGLFLEVDDTQWSMHDAFRPLEAVSSYIRRLRCPHHLLERRS